MTEAYTKKNKRILPTEKLLLLISQLQSTGNVAGLLYNFSKKAWKRGRRQAFAQRFDPQATYQNQKLSLSQQSHKLKANQSFFPTRVRLITVSTYSTKSKVNPLDVYQSKYS